MVYLIYEMFIEHRVKGFPEDFGLKGFELVGKDVDFHIRVRCPS